MTRPAPARLVALVALLVLVVTAAASALCLETTTELTHFLVSPEAQAQGRLSRALAQSEPARTMILTFEAEDPRVARAAAREVARDLQGDPEVAWIRAQLDAEVDAAVYRLLAPRALRLASARPEVELPPRLDASGIRETLRDLRRELGGPMSALVKRLAPADPWLFTRTRLQGLRGASEGTLTVEDGVLTTEDGRAAVLLLATHHSAFDSTAQRPFGLRLEAALGAARQRAPSLEIERSSLHRLAVRSEDDIRADVQRISFLSAAGIVLVFGTLYRSVRLLLLGFVPLLAGFTVATAVGILVFGKLHGLTLAFGATLIGICIDYPVHYFGHLVVHPEDSAQDVLRRLWPGILVGAATTIAGFLGLAGASFPGIREIGVFSTAGIVGALAATRWILPGLVPRRRSSVRVTERCVRWLDGVLTRAHARRGVLAALAGAGILAAGAGVWRATWLDDAAALNRLEPDLLAEDERVRERVGRFEGSRLIASIGPDVETALQIAERVDEALRPLQQDGAVVTRSVSHLLLSRGLQERNLAVFRDAGPGSLLQQALREEGFAPEAFAPALRRLTTLDDPPLDWADVEGSPLRPVLGSFRVSMGDATAILTFVREVSDPAAVASAVSTVQGALWFDQREFLATTYRAYRERILGLVGLGLVAVFLVLLGRYRRWSVALAAFAPALAAAICTLGALAWGGDELQILHVVGLLLVLSMGVDYGVFLVESRRWARGTSGALLGVLLAWASTVLAFGLLALSANPAMHALGATVGLGVSFSLVLAPLALALLPGEPEIDR